MTEFRLPTDSTQLSDPEFEHSLFMPGETNRTTRWNFTTKADLLMRELLEVQTPEEQAAVLAQHTEDN